MTYNDELSCKLAKEMSELWYECKVRCDRIEEITKEIKELALKES
jgi:lysozyme family protein